MSQNQNNNELLVRLMTVNDFWPMMRDKVMAAVVQMRRGRANVTFKHGIHACCWTVWPQSCLAGCQQVRPLLHRCCQSWATFGLRAVAPVTCHSQKMKTAKCKSTSATIKEP